MNLPPSALSTDSIYGVTAHWSRGLSHVRPLRRLLDSQQPYHADVRPRVHGVACRPFGRAHHNNFLFGMQLNGVDPHRVSFTIGYVYWTNYDIRNIVYDYDSGHMYFTVGAQVHMSSDPSYLFFSAEALCRTYGFPCLRSSTRRTRPSLRASSSSASRTFSGLMRPAPDTPFQWQSSGMTTDGYRYRNPLQPFNGTKQCAKMEGPLDGRRATAASSSSR